MMRQQNDQGNITISNAVFTKIAGVAASNCFGVKGMCVRSVADGLVHLLRREAMSKGVKVTEHPDGTISIDLHIMTNQGINLSALGSSIIGEVRYMVQSMTGASVKAVNIYIDSMMPAD